MAGSTVQSFYVKPYGKGRCAQMPILMPVTHDGQSMIVQGSLVDKPNEPKSYE